MLRWDMLSYGSSDGFRYAWARCVTFRSVNFWQFSRGWVFLGQLGSVEAVGVGSGPFGSVAFWQLSFVSLWLGGVRCGAIRLGSYG